MAAGGACAAERLVDTTLKVTGRKTLAKADILTRV